MAASRSLVFRDKISCLCVRGFPSNEGVKKEYPLKRHYFAVIGSYSVKKKRWQIGTDMLLIITRTVLGLLDL